MLVAEALETVDHDRLDASLKAKLIEESVVMPYSKSGEKAAEAVSLTSQTVMNCIRELDSIDNDAVEIKLKKKAIRTLYIEADEGHVALQTGGNVEPKLVYVHEGIEEIGQGRMKLKKERIKLDQR